MDFERLNGDIKEMRRRNRGLGLAVGVLAAGQILALIVILNLLGTVRTVVVPPSIELARLRGNAFCGVAYSMACSGRTIS